MTVECVAILVLLACIALVIRQKGNQNAFFAVIPLYWMPVAYLFTAAVLPCLPVESEIILLVFQAGSYLLALVVSCIVIGVLGRAIRRKRSRRAYYLVSGGFNFLLAVLFLLELFSVQALPL